MELTPKAGWKINPDPRVVKAITSRIDKCGGECPCHNESDDKMCPCSDYREKDECHCNLYVKQ